MVLGLTAEAYAVYVCGGIGNPPYVASLNGALLFFTSFTTARESIPALIAAKIVENGVAPPYIWIEPVSRLWLDGIQQ